MTCWQHRDKVNRGHNCTTREPSAAQTDRQGFTLTVLQPWESLCAARWPPPHVAGWALPLLQRQRRLSRLRYWAQKKRRWPPSWWTVSQAHPQVEAPSRGWTPGRTPARTWGWAARPWCPVACARWSLFQTQPRRPARHVPSAPRPAVPPLTCASCGEGAGGCTRSRLRKRKRPPAGGRDPRWSGDWQKARTRWRQRLPPGWC